MVTNLLRGINHPREKIVLLLLFEEGSRGFCEAISSVNLGNEKIPQVFSRAKQSPRVIKGNYSDSRGWSMHPAGG